VGGQRRQQADDAGDGAVRGPGAEQLRRHGSPLRRRVGEALAERRQRARVADARAAVRVRPARQG
jgi:hypothetical protein